MGSKARIARDIAPIINNIIKNYSINTYIEPFVGGANMIEHVECTKKFGYDNNEYLISFWNAIKTGWNPSDFYMSREMYNKIKDNKDDYPKHVVALAGFCATYNAKWFGGYAGIVKTKIDTTRNYYDEAVRNVLNQREKIHDVEFETKDYRLIKDVRGALIYCDPPYENSTGYAEQFNHKEFWEWIKEISNTNFVLISEYNSPEGFVCLWNKELTTTLDKNSRSQSTEKLFTYDNWIFNQLIKNKFIA